jgi:hypothetical protein
MSVYAVIFSRFATLYCCVMFGVLVCWCIAVLMHWFIDRCCYIVMMFLCILYAVVLLRCCVLIYVVVWLLLYVVLLCCCVVVLLCCHYMVWSWVVVTAMNVYGSLLQVWLVMIMYRHYVLCTTLILRTIYCVLCTICKYYVLSTMYHDTVYYVPWLCAVIHITLHVLRTIMCQCAI